MAENRSDILLLQKKKQLLEQCLEKTEELLSCLTSQNTDELSKAVSCILAERAEIINELQLLESSIKTIFNRSDLDKEKKEINHLVNLLLTLNKDAERLIKSVQEKLLANIKVHTQKQKIIPYASAPMPQRGRLMDYKK